VPGASPYAAILHNLALIWPVLPIANILAARAEIFSVQEGVTQAIKVRVLSKNDILQMALEALTEP
jgi:hypothetical protein